VPIYEYICEECSRQFEELVFGDGAVACPHCGSRKTGKLLSCCRHKTGGSADSVGAAAAPSSGSSCSGCSASSCAGCH